jgi:hypothetical protein
MMFRFVRIIFLALFILAIGASPLFAEAGRAVPEIDPSLASSAITLITGGLLILKSKSKRK